jgi:hypothetical protein
MVKNLEVGFVFPLDFIIEKSDKYSVTNAEKIQVVRFKTSMLHGETYLMRSLTVTPLTEGKVLIKSFINAENIQTITKKFYMVIR